MAISESNLKIFASSKMTDYADGGGKMSAIEIVDGVVNNIFNDISQLDRTYGRVSLRKTFVAVDTSATDSYLGAHVIVTAPPDDEQVGVVIFDTASWTDEREAAKSRVEQYSTLGIESQWVLLGNHVAGQGAIALFSKENFSSLQGQSTHIISVGDLVALSVEYSNLPNTVQFVRIQKLLTHETQQFTDESGAIFYKDVLVLETSNVLRYDFKGGVPSKITTVNGSQTKIRLASVSDSARYFGVKPVTAQLLINDTTLRIGSPYAAIVPSSNAETPLIDIAPGSRLNYIASGGRLSVSATINSVSAPYTASLFLPRAFMPNSLALSINGVSYVNSDGKLVLSSGAGGAYTGTVQADTGKISISKATSFSNTAVVAEVTPAVAIYDNGLTNGIAVTEGNRALNYVFTLNPPPSPQSLTVEYMVLGNWYRLYDDGLGKLSGGGAENIGTGTINYATGSGIVTLAAYADVGSIILVTAAAPTNYQVETYVARQPIPSFSGQLANTPVTPGTVVVTWLVNGVAKTATAAPNGDFSGHASGRIVHATGKYQLIPNVLPSSGTEFSIAYQKSVEQVDSLPITPGVDGAVSFTLTQTPIRPGSVHINYFVKRFNTTKEGWVTFTRVNTQLEITDDGAGHLLADGQLVGTINYSSGVGQANLSRSYTLRYLVEPDSRQTRDPIRVSGPASGFSGSDVLSDHGVFAIGNGSQMGWYGADGVKHYSSF